MTNKFGRILRIQHDENIHGRDFVVGDLHGQIHLLNKFMKMGGFDPLKDRMFSVGDLVDRGINSLACLKLIREPWFFPVLGNHEQMFHAAMFTPFDMYGRSFRMNGGDWVNENVDHQELNTLAFELEKMSRMRTINGKNKIHIIHAELNVATPMQQEPITDAMIDDDELLMKMMTIQTMDGDYSFWGRGSFGGYYNGYIKKSLLDKEREVKYNSPELSTIVCGHTILKRPGFFGKFLNIDLGAYATERLAFYDVKNDQVLVVQKDEDDMINYSRKYLETGEQ